jgi:2-oxo-4-hydroxy-4-carboxy--5-ureidoimidazoline (OHCU) decarboxylase
MTGLPPIDSLNAHDDASFVESLSALFEGAPGFLQRLAAARPYSSYGQLLERAEDIATRMPEQEQIALIDSHPRIGAPPATVSAQSHREQGYGRDADADADSSELQVELDHLNAQYEARFGFRFVIFVAGRPRSALVPIMREQLHSDRETEKDRALRDVIAIARDRAAGLATEEGA